MSRIALIGKNSVEYIRNLLNIWNSGNCAVLIDYRIPLETAVKMMREAKATTCYIENDIYNIHDEFEIEFVFYDRNSDQAEFLPDDIYNSFKGIYSGDEAVIIYSSGTTGNSKGIILSHYAINTNADAIIDYMKPKHGDCIYIVKTLSHSSTLTGELLVALKSRMNLVVTPVIPHPRQIIKNTTEFNVTILCLNPTLLSMLADEYMTAQTDLSTLQKIYVSGSVLTDKVFEKAHKAFENKTVYNVYGLSEAGPRVSAQTEYCCKSNSVGRPLPNIEVVIVDESGKKLLRGEKGIVYVKTPSIFSGYVTGEEKHRSFYYGWLNTGDIGFEDDFGEIHIVGRIDDVIEYNSHKVYPSDVEKMILENPLITDCVVSKCIVNNVEMIGCLYVSDNNCAVDIVRRLKGRLAQYEIPKKFLKTESIPRNIRGKINRKLIAGILSDIDSEG